MSEQADIGQLAADNVVTRWDEGRAMRALDGFERKRVRQKRTRAAASACALILAGAAIFWLAPELRPGPAAPAGQAPAVVAAVDEPPQEDAPPTPPEPAFLVRTDEGGQKTIAFEDGSTAQTTSPSAQLEVASISADQLRLELEQGAARFTVTPDRTRRFEVDAGEVEVTVLGTVFEVERLEAGRARVRVERGLVRVSAGGTDWELPAGSEGVYPPEEHAAVEEVEADEPDRRAPRKARRPAKSAPDWRELARAGDFEAAAKLLREDASRVPAGDPAALMLAADTMRYAGAPAEAAPYLERVYQKHASDRRAAPASFTHGLLLLEKLGRPADAAAAFARVQKLGPGKALAEDALAREVEAWYRSKRADRARARAQTYLERYPDGHRADAVRHYGDLE